MSVDNREIQNSTLNRRALPLRQDSDARVYTAGDSLRKPGRNHAVELNNIHIQWLTLTISEHKKTIDILDVVP